MTTPDMHLDTGALALGALPPEELLAIEDHIQTCESCRDELAGFRETVARLADVAAQTPPASLRRNVLAAITVTPQLPPEQRAPTEPPAGRHAAAEETDEGAPPDNVRPIRPWYRRPAALIAAAAAAVLIAGSVFVVNRFRAQEEVAQTPEQCVATAADRTELTPEDGQGEVSYAPSCAAVTVDVSGLPALPDDRTYQLWALSAEQDVPPRSLGLLPQAADGGQQVVTEPTRPGEVAVAITAEPASGSVAPTLPIVWTTELTP
jgi:anti-sigma-K factor RskA